jgi:peptidoglycan/xylan/chitin deacetylase (PgdA/CDA1 family)
VRRAVAVLALATLALRPNPARPAEPAGVAVLMYHRVDANVPSDAVGRDLTVEPGSFAAPQHAVVLTFDDGYDDAATTALPLLRKYGARGTFYVSSGFVGTPRHLSWKQLRELRAAGMEVACHGTFHLDLSTLDRAGQLREAAGCMRRFAHYLGGAPPVTYAYPAGKYDGETLAIMRSLGIVAAFTERPGVVEDLARPYELPRRRIRHDDTVANFADLVAP